MKRRSGNLRSAYPESTFLRSPQISGHTVSVPLMEAPVMIGLVNVAFWLQKRWYPQAAPVPAMVNAAQEVCPPEQQLMK